MSQSMINRKQAQCHIKRIDQQDEQNAGYGQGIKAASCNHAEQHKKRKDKRKRNKDKPYRNREETPPSG